MICVKQTVRGAQGFLTYAHVDCPDDVWRWAIVTGYQDAQDYDEVVVAFAEDFEPSLSVLTAMLGAMETDFRSLDPTTEEILKLGYENPLPEKRMRSLLKRTLETMRRNHPEDFEAQRSDDEIIEEAMQKRKELALVSGLVAATERKP